MRWSALLTLTLISCQSVRVTSDAMPQAMGEAAPGQSKPTSVPRTQEPPRVDDLERHQPQKPDSVGTFTYQFENDTFSNNSDNNLTAAFGITWTSAAVNELGEDNWFRKRVENDFAFLPTVSDPSYRKFFQLAFNMEMHTAKDTTDPDPPPDNHPYSGIITLDSAIYSISEDSMHAYFLRLGFVGPATGAEGIQNWMHDATGRPRAQGWDTQLSNEPIVNLFYVYQRRLLRTTASEAGLGFDLGIHGGAGLGNFYIGANVGAQARLGFALPPNFERSFPINLYEEVPNRRMQGVPFSGYLFLSGTSTLVDRYLPVDGNTFTSSRSGERDDFYSQLSFGIALTYERFTLTYRTTMVGTDSQIQGRDNDFSDITLSYSF